MKKFTPIIASMLVAASATASAAAFPAGWQKKMHAEPFRYSKKSSCKPAFALTPMADKALQRNVTPSGQLEGSDEYGYLDMPDGSTWYFTAEYALNIVEHEHWTERIVTGFKYNIYNSACELQGTISDNLLPLDEGRLAVASVTLSSVVTKKFFNSDNNYELIVQVAYNKPNYEIETASRVYSLGGQTDADGHNQLLNEMPGYVTDAVNMAKDAWSEDYYLSFFRELHPNIDDYEDFTEFAAAYKSEVKTYKKGGWSGAPSVIHTYEVPNANLPGDRMSTPFCFLLNHGGQLWILTQEYEKWFYDNVIGPGDGSDGGDPTPDNKLIVKLHSYSGYGEPQLVQETKVACTTEDTNPNALYRYYSIGNLDYQDDVIFNGNEASFNLTVEKYMKNDDDNYLKSYYKLDKEGNITATIFDEASYLIGLNDVPGQERQYFFVKPDANNEWVFYAVDIESVTPRATFPAINGPVSLKANVDRVAVAGGYEYAFATSEPELDDEGNIIEHVAYVDMNGEVARVENVNLGKDVAIAQVYIEQAALNPYLFNTDGGREYMWLVKRYTGNSSETREEFLVVSPVTGTVMQQLPDTDKGAIKTVSLLSGNEGSALSIVFYNMDSRKYYQDFYNLPVVKFAGGGDGTEANPYKIATIGDLQAVREAPAACYELTADIDAMGYTFSSIESFTGTLDGKGHTISNLVLSAKGGLFQDISSKEDAAAGRVAVKNLTFVGVDANNVSTTAFGVLANDIRNACVENVHVYGFDYTNATADATIGVLVGRTALHSGITKCSVSSANVNAPESSSVGGIVAAVRTGSSVTECSFLGTIKAGTEVGGIAGTIANDAKVADCHVDADLTAKNTVGGIVGSSSRGEITRCYVEGRIEATTPLSVYVDRGPIAGGIVGELAGDYSSEETVASEEDNKAVVSNCFVALTELSGFTSTVAPSYGEQQSTIHRIVGKTSFNDEPEAIGYDDDYEPIFAEGATGKVEAGLSNNYAVADLPRGAEAMEAGAATTEGADVAADALDRDWFAGTLGFGYGADKAWNEATTWDPALNHETTNFLNPSQIVTRVGDKFFVNVVYVTRQPMTEEDALGSLIVEADETYMEMTGRYTFANNTLSIEFTALKEGTVDIAVAGASGKVTIDKASSIDNVTVGGESVAISFDGSYVKAQGTSIEVYNLHGVKVADGRDAVNVTSLSRGVYVAVATDASGSRSTLKISVK